MNPWQYCLLILPLGVAVALARSALKKRRMRRERDFTRRLETLLRPRETVKVICPSPSGHWVLTSARLLLESGEGFTAIPFGKIKSLKGQDKAGKTTTSPTKMVSLTVKAQADHTLRSSAPEFVLLAKLLRDRVQKQKKPAKKSLPEKKRSI